MEAAYFLVFFLLNGVIAQSQPSVEDAIDTMSASLPGNVTKDQIEEIKNKSEVLFKEKCEKNGGADSYSQVKKAFEDFPKCLQSLVDFEVLQKEVEAAKSTGTVDEVFKKYCDKTPEFKGCINNVLDSAKPCFTPKERGNIKIVHNVTEQLAEFICFKGGDRIALFIAEGGPRCFEDKQAEIQSCFNGTIGNQIQDFTGNFSSIESIPEISFDEEDCRKMSELQKCMVKVLESCKQPTTANIVESLVKFIRGATPCKSFGAPTDPANPDSASGLAVTSLSLLMTTYTVLIH